MFGFLVEEYKRFYNIGFRLLIENVIIYKEFVFFYFLSFDFVYYSVIGSRFLEKINDFINVLNFID